MHMEHTGLAGIQIQRTTGCLQKWQDVSTLCILNICYEQKMILKRGFKEWLTSSQVILGMILVQVFISALQLLSRVILVHGSFIFSLIAYCHIVAAICVAPFALYFERCVFHSSYLFLMKLDSLLLKVLRNYLHVAVIFVTLSRFLKCMQS